jgi:hypothetical protein
MNIHDIYFFSFRKVYALGDIKTDSTTVPVPSHIRSVSTMLPWKQNRFLLGKLLLVAEYQITVKSAWVVRPASIKSTFLSWGPRARSVVFPNMSIMTFYLWTWSPQITQVSYKSFPTISPLCVLGIVSRTYIFGFWMFIFIWLRTMKIRLLNNESEYTASSCSSVSGAYMLTQNTNTHKQIYRRVCIEANLKGVFSQKFRDKLIQHQSIFNILRTWEAICTLT